MIQSHPTLLDDYLVSWKKAFLTDVTSFDRSQLRPFLGIRVGIMVIIPLVIGLLTNPTPVYIPVSLGVFYVSIPEGFPTKWSRMRVLSLTCLVNPIVFSIATSIKIESNVLIINYFMMEHIHLWSILDVGMT